MDMICSYDGLFGYIGTSKELVSQVAQPEPTPPATPEALSGDLSISELSKAYRVGNAKPEDVAAIVAQKTSEYQEKDPAVWTHLMTSEKLIADAKSIQARYAGKPLPPLYGIPFAVKDNIDVAGIPTTAASEAYTYMPQKNAKVVDDLLDAGALFVGKTNLDQLATGLSGCRSPYGTPRSVYGKDRVPGGSSSGSAVAVGAHLVSFALGTDTAGSGRAPAAFNGITGFKPTKGTLSAAGLVPACRSLDTISILAQTVEDARAVWLVADQGPDESDAFAKPQSSLPVWKVDFRGPKAGGFVFGIPPSSVIESLCSKPYQRLFNEAVTRLQACGGRAQVLPWEAFQGGSDLVYKGTFVAERIHCIGPDFFAKHISTLHPTIQQLFKAALTREYSAYDVFRDQEFQREYSRQAARLFEEIDVLLVPTTPCHPTIAEMEKDPLGLNAKLGEFTQFGNVLDLCGVSVPVSTYEEGDETLPFGVVLLGASGTDGKVIDIAKELEKEVNFQPVIRK